MQLERIEITPFALIAGEALQHRRTGYLTVLRPPLRRVLFWSQGDLVMSVSSDRADSLGQYLVQRGVLTAAEASVRFADPNEQVAAVHELGILTHSERQELMREWLASQFLPLFSIDEGTAAFTDDEAIAPEKRVFLPSTLALYLEGVRSITNGLVLRRSLGDLKREIKPASDALEIIDELPFTESERAVAMSLREPCPLESFLRSHAAYSSTVGKIAIALLALGAWEQTRPDSGPQGDSADMQRDMQMLAQIGADDRRSLQAVALSRQLQSIDHYRLLDLPRGATRAQISAACERLKRHYAPESYPAAAREAVMAIQRRLDEAHETLSDSHRRTAYDDLLHGRPGEAAASIQQRVARRTIAQQNLARAKALAGDADYYGAIILLKQAVKFAPDMAEAWLLLGSCQERNPKWRREAAESFQMALSVEPNMIDAMIALGDLYRNQGLTTRAQTCFEDALKIDPANQQAKTRLQGLKKR